jgi:hypothetical protein
MNLLTYSPNLTKKDTKPKKTPILERLLLVTIIMGNDVDWRCTVILRGGEDGATHLSLHLNVSSSLEDNDASSFARPSVYLHTSLRCLETKM